MHDRTTIIHTPTHNLKESLSFYQRLQFLILSRENPTIVTDGKIMVEINPDRFARAGLKLIREDWSAELNGLSSIANVVPLDDGYLLSDPNGVRIYLTTRKLDIDYEYPDQPFALTGNFAGVSLESTDLQRCVAFWELLGFNLAQGTVDQGWLTLSDGGNIEISIMKTLSCPHLFFNPSLTYFNGKNNLEHIDKIKAAGISIAEEVTCFNQEGIVDNIIIRDPGGYGFFIFND